MPQSHLSCCCPTSSFFYERWFSPCLYPKDAPIGAALELDTLQGSLSDPKTLESFVLNGLGLVSNIFYLSSGLYIPSELKKLKKKLATRDFKQITLQSVKVMKLASDVLVGIECMKVLNPSSDSRYSLCDSNMALLGLLAYLHILKNQHLGLNLKNCSNLTLLSIPTAQKLIGPVASTVACAVSSTLLFLDKCKKTCLGSTDS